MTLVDIVKSVRRELRPLQPVPRREYIVPPGSHAVEPLRLALREKGITPGRFAQKGPSAR